MARTRSVRGRAGGGMFGGGSRRNPTVMLLGRPERNPALLVLGFLIRFRAELAITGVTVLLYLQLRNLIGPDYTIIVMVAAPLVVLAVPVLRRYVVRRMWCVLTRHRMRTCFTQTHTMTHRGRMPFLWWSRPSPVGERVRVWLPAGLSVKDLERVTDELAAACWARDVRVVGLRSQAALALVEIVRRDPLTGDALVPAMVHDLTPTGSGEDTEDGNVVPLPARTTLPAPRGNTDEAALVRPPGTSLRKPTAARTAPARTDKTADPDTVTGFGGVDVSDYV